MKYRYKIEWHYFDDIEIHITYVECTSKNVNSAYDRFKRVYAELHNWNSNRPVVVVESVISLGQVINKCW